MAPDDDRVESNIIGAEPEFVGIEADHLIEAVVVFQDFAHVTTGRFGEMGVHVLARFRSIPAALILGPDEAVDSLSRIPHVEFVERNGPLALAEGQAARNGRSELPMSELRSLWSEGLDGAGTTVAVVDTGIDTSHPDLPLVEKVARNVRLELVEAAQGCVKPIDERDTDVDGHGTHVAGIVGGLGRASGGEVKGAAPGCSIVGVTASGFGTVAYAALCLDWILAERSAIGIDVVNCSWSSPVSRLNRFDENRSINRVSRLLSEAGVIVVAAVGNWGERGLSEYALSPHVIGVANYDASTREIAPDSGRGPSSPPSGLPKCRPDLAAPGVDVTSTAGRPLRDPAPSVPVTDYRSQSGTSQATAYVSGVAALLVQACAKRGLPSRSKVEEAIFQTATATLKRRGGRYVVGSGYDLEDAEDRDQGRGAVCARRAADFLKPRVVG